MIKSINIDKFRIFEKCNIVLGKYITVVSGCNATGKSTILALLAHSSQLDGYKPILFSSYKSTWGEIIKTSDKDLLSKGMYEISFTDISFDQVIENVGFRTTIQKENNRVRILPVRMIEEKISSKKVEWPVLYLGLSRLYPLGEARDHTNIDLELNDDEKKEFIKNYTNILSLHSDKIDEIVCSSIKGNKKRAVGINTNAYDYTSNSAGQDNIGQILCAVMSFEKLKKQLSEKYNGGLLLIDEIESTLHPAAQYNLLHYLIRECRKLSIQVVFTTHSIFLIKHIIDKIKHNKADENNHIELHYFSNATRKLKHNRNPDFTAIENDLCVKMNDQNNQKVKIYTEDKEARWFLKYLLRNEIDKFDILDVTFGDNQLQELYVKDTYYKSVLVILDGDTPDKEIGETLKKANSTIRNIIKLPGNNSPEKVLYEFLEKLPYDDKFWKKSEEMSFTYRYFKDYGPYCAKYDNFQKERDKYKNWLIDNTDIFETLKVVDYWITRNRQSVTNFKKKITQSYNKLSRLLVLK